MQITWGQEPSLKARKSPRPMSHQLRLPQAPIKAWAGGAQMLVLRAPGAQPEPLRTTTWQSLSPDSSRLLSPNLPATPSAATGRTPAHHVTQPGLGTLGVRGHWGTCVSPNSSQGGIPSQSAGQGGVPRALSWGGQTAGPTQGPRWAEEGAWRGALCPHRCPSLETLEPLWRNRCPQSC